jgi:hypothetical protein
MLDGRWVRSRLRQARSPRQVNYYFTPGGVGTNSFKERPSVEALAP